ncbi:MFS transporter [Enterovirga aerilata]|uniref:MFS transporter n=1 Tax=Enterovirga aerilata TaxID=2730920 RepID=A0A849I7U4_9HYPH|nr:MFS transporter [Enterovirga sp. DB1703]NNM72365.1 MFS transporter [Enterovirga sp. DB1703]
MRRERLIPIIVATALFMENTDSTVLSTALPAIAADLRQDPIALKLALTSYLVSLAVFIPVSGWMADRYGARNVFRAALGVFMAGSLACAAAGSLAGFVAARFLQGMGGAMMVPVGRLVLLRSVPRGELVNAMAWVTMPALIGPVLGPPLGGFITTYFDWRWIFIINLPVGLVGILLATRFMQDVREEERRPLDRFGFLTFGFGLALLMLGFSTGGRHLIPIGASIAAGLLGGALVALYVRHALRAPAPLVDLALLRLPTMRNGLIGGVLFRIGVGAIPFLLPLMVQLGFGLSPVHSGLLTFASAAGAMVMKGLAARILRRFGFRQVLVWNAMVASAFIAANGLFTPATPAVLILAILLVGGCFRSLQFTALNTIVYADVPTDRMSAATSLVSVTQQVALSAGIAVGAGVLQFAIQVGHGSELAAADFWPAFLAVGLISASSALFFARLDPDAGAEMAGRAAIAAKPMADSA